MSTREQKMIKNPLRIWMKSGSFSTLVSTEWLADNMNKVKIVDGSWHMPATQRKGEMEFLEKRIKVFFLIIM
jgi:3-mercaptopyruvate sulfurtransferase SseA